MSSLEGDRFLDPAELVALFEALEDESVEVRIAAFEALTRLPLAPSDWLEVASFITRVLDSSDSDGERVAVRDASPWVVAAKDRPPPVAEWMGVEPPGFIDLSPGERADVEAALAVRDRRTWERLRELLDPREQAVAVTLLFEEVLRGGSRGTWTPLYVANSIVEDVHALQGRFRPDLAGLSLLYQRVAKELFGAYRSGVPLYDPPPLYGAEPGLFRFVEIREEGVSPRTFCYQLGWTVSRGGLQGLVPRLATQLASDDRDERMAAAYLIADAAGYLTHPYPAVFGGSSNAPRRPPISDTLIEDVSPEPTRGLPTREPTRGLPEAQ